MNTGMGAMQGYSGTGGQGGGNTNGTMMGMQQAPAAYQYQNA